MLRWLLIVLLVFPVGCGTLTVSDQAINPNIKTGNYAGVATGAYVNGPENLPSFQTMIGKQLAVVLSYVHWQDLFPLAESDAVYNNGSLPLITWEPWISDQTGTLEAIAAGNYDAYVRSFFQAAKAWGKPVFLRFAHEMNGNWYPWDGVHNGGSSGPERYKRAWLYIYNVREAVGADNVYLVWSPNHKNLPAESWNDMVNYYPGDQYVDWVGLDGYNWGYSQWESFDSVFGAAYTKLICLTAKPLMIGEFACAEQPGADKAAWISDAFTKILSSYPRIKIFCWFNINKERDWRADSSPAAAAALKNILQKAAFLDRIQ
jgi:hypothetical protein